MNQQKQNYIIGQLKKNCKNKNVHKLSTIRFNTFCLLVCLLLYAIYAQKNHPEQLLPPPTLKSYVGRYRTPLSTQNTKTNYLKCQNK